MQIVHRDDHRVWDMWGRHVDGFGRLEVSIGVQTCVRIRIVVEKSFVLWVFAMYILNTHDHSLTWVLLPILPFFSECTWKLTMLPLLLSVDCRSLEFFSWNSTSGMLDQYYIMQRIKTHRWNSLATCKWYGIKISQFQHRRFSKRINWGTWFESDPLHGPRSRSRPKCGVEFEELFMGRDVVSFSVGRSGLPDIQVTACIILVPCPNTPEVPTDQISRIVQGTHTKYGHRRVIWVARNYKKYNWNFTTVGSTLLSKKFHWKQSFSK